MNSSLIWKKKPKEIYIGQKQIQTTRRPKGTAQKSSEKKNPTKDMKQSATNI